jgi:hypothetical protein
LIGIKPQLLDEGPQFIGGGWQQDLAMLDNIYQWAQQLVTPL